ncbi:MAG: DUF1330 domain-containing protein [Candidatus Thiodiazotropha sp.]
MAPSIIEQYGGELLVRGGEVVTLEGPADNRGTFIIEFPIMERVKNYTTHQSTLRQ